MCALVLRQLLGYVMYKFIILLLCAIFLGSGTASAATFSIGGGTTTVTRYPTFSRLAVSSTDADLVYAYASYFTEGDIYRSTDAGTSWSKFSSFPYFEFGVKKLVPGNSASTLYVLTSYGLYVTTDAGATWSILLSGVETETVALDPDQGALLIGTKAFGILRSLDGGSTWSVISTGIPSVAVQSLYISSVVPADGSARMLLAGTADGIYRSLDGGEAWSNAGDGLPAATSVKTIEVSPADVRALYAASDKGIFKSSDSGETWTLFSSTVVDELTVIYSGTADTVIAILNSNLQKSQDGTLPMHHLPCSILQQSAQASTYRVTPAKAGTELPRGSPATLRPFVPLTARRRRSHPRCSWGSFPRLAHPSSVRALPAGPSPCLPTSTGTPCSTREPPVFPVATRRSPRRDICLLR